MEPASDGFLSHEVAADESLIHDRELLPSFQLWLGEEAALQQWNPQGFGVARVHLVHDNGPRVLLAAGNLHGHAPIAKRMHPSVHTHRSDTWDSRDALHHLMKE